MESEQPDEKAENEIELKETAWEIREIYRARHENY